MDPRHELVTTAHLSFNFSLFFGLSFAAIPAATKQDWLHYQERERAISESNIIAPYLALCYEPMASHLISNN